MILRILRYTQSNNVPKSRIIWLRPYKVIKFLVLTIWKNHKRQKTIQICMQMNYAYSDVLEETRRETCAELGFSPGSLSLSLKFLLHALNVHTYCNRYNILLRR